MECESAVPHLWMRSVPDGQIGLKFRAGSLGIIFEAKRTPPKAKKFEADPANRELGR